METYHPNVPIYLQIMHQIKHIILSGEWRAGDKIPSVRDLAVRFTVNPNTMQRSLSELERQGLIYTERTSGRFVTEKEEVIRSVRKQVAAETIALFLDRMQDIGFSRDEIIPLLKEEEVK